VKQGLHENRQLAKSHYENFSIGSFFLPKSIRSDLSNIYAFCRLADDIADEASEGFARSTRLDEWGVRLNRTAVGEADTPLFAALGETIRRRSLPLEPFHDLLAAFKQDLIVTRYESWSQLFAYCRLSADPVGRLVLAVCGLNDAKYFAYSDKICTGLQLANHWQDVAEDHRRGRIYIPAEVMKEFGVTEETIKRNIPTSEFRRMMLFLCEEARRLFDEGEELIHLVGKPLSPQLFLYHGGGLAALKAISSANGDVLSERRRVGNPDRLRLLIGSTLLWLGFRR